LVACYLLVENRAVNQVLLCVLCVCVCVCVCGAHILKYTQIIAPINKYEARYRKAPRDQIRIAVLTGGLIAQREYKKRRTTGGRPRLLPRTFVTVRDYTRALYNTAQCYTMLVEREKEKERKSGKGKKGRKGWTLAAALFYMADCISLFVRYDAPRRHASRIGRYTIF